MKHLDLFSGIGGAALAVDSVWPGAEHAFCEIDPFCQQVLKKHWPNAYIHGDIRTFTYPLKPRTRSESGSVGNETGEASSSRGKSIRQAHGQISSSGIEPTSGVYLLTGGFPCQPFSQAGRRKGTEDDRHLWPQMFRVIREFRPTWVVGENVAGLLSISGGLVFEQVCLDLESEGYEVQAFVIPAVAVNAPHRRDRVWIIAHSASKRPDAGIGDGEGRHILRNENGDATQGESERKGRKRGIATSSSASADSIHSYGGWERNWLEVATRLCTLDDGIPNGLARPRGWRNAALKGAGNAWVPQVAEEIFKAIKKVDSL